MRTFSHLPDLGDGGAAVGRGLRVLVADDERDTVLTLGILLRSEGFDVRTTTRGADVPGAVRDFNPDLVLLDIGMPGPPLIAVTAYRTSADKVLARDSGFHHHIGKPYNPVALIHLLSILKRTY